LSPPETEQGGANAAASPATRGHAPPAVEQARPATADEGARSSARPADAVPSEDAKGSVEPSQAAAAPSSSESTPTGNKRLDRAPDESSAGKPAQGSSGQSVEAASPHPDALKEAARPDRAADKSGAADAVPARVNPSGQAASEPTPPEQKALELKPRLSAEAPSIRDEAQKEREPGPAAPQAGNQASFSAPLP
jgi:hypothetical protein